MDRDIVYNIDITTAECFSCKEVFRLYTVQKSGMDLCAICNNNYKSTELISLHTFLLKVIKFAEKENLKLNDRLVIDVSNLLEELQS